MRKSKVLVEHLGTIVHDPRRRIRVRKAKGEVVGLGMDYDKIVNTGPTPLADLRMAISE
jgi:hypothetical protein